MPSSAVQTCALDRKSTRLNSSHTIISYAVFCLKKKKCLSHSTVQHSTHTHATVRTIRQRQRQAHVTEEEMAQRGRLGRRVRADSSFFFLMIGRPPRSTLFPYTALFRSDRFRARSPRRVGRARLVATPDPQNHVRSEEHTSELQSHDNLVCRLLL